ncbi:aminotransferase class V-fold PLP-dependent enzyme [Rathayibacter sp. VKM Ac-2804]|uniref:aminotransferase class V-fold PLP-dependent enzyme n=1 Tax=Rathayibacter sp. VKM Ac-2804 TaxID=2609257 RepID=UPI00132E8CA0|nr:aminotransferase class V-fold PLP-dependent enzyme [Rathayibacter sp. VKM Ac-2804]QHF24556.1 aminotransferase class V-fold PLP-dependent enzyme [Rathayibacter sp. VKM Ac-2804]
MRGSLDSAQFRELFPALRNQIWLDTSGSAPGCAPVVESLRGALDDWLTGDFTWLEWDETQERARSAFAAYVGVPESTVAVLGSVTEAAASISASLPPGDVVVSNEEYRSMLWPFTDLDPDRNPLRRVDATNGVVTTADLERHIDADTALLAVSEVLTSNGNRLDLSRLRAATAAHDARLFVDVTQTLGVLDTDAFRIDADYVAVHGYKYMLAPRGAAWLHIRPDRIASLQPVLRGWKSSEPPHGYFGDNLDLPASARRADTSPAWFSWIGAISALEVLQRVSPSRSEARVTGLASRFAHGAENLGLSLPPVEQQSHVVVAYDSGSDFEAKFAREYVRAAASPGRLRVSFHYFNTEGDVDRALAVLEG